MIWRILFVVVLVAMLNLSGVVTARGDLTISDGSWHWSGSSGLVGSVVMIVVGAVLCVRFDRLRGLILFLGRPK